MKMNPTNNPINNPTNNPIIFKQVNLKTIHQSGQSFRWQALDHSQYLIVHGHNVLVVEQRGLDAAVLYMRPDQDPGYWHHYFDLDRPYQEIDAYLMAQYPRLNQAILYGQGMRLLRQDAFEMLITFMMSANNHIPRIRNFIKAISEQYGTALETNVDLDTNMDPRVPVLKGQALFAFPNRHQLAHLNEGHFRALGAGYRSPYFVETLQMLDQYEAQGQGFDTWGALTTPALIERLKTLKGVGQKVAECIALFGFGHWECFPVDTWIKKAAAQLIDRPMKTDKQISHALMTYFPKYQGLIQQYIFYYMRETGGIT